MSNEEMVIYIQSGKDKDGSMMAELWSQNKGFIYKIALKYSDRAELDDLVQEGFIGLSNAVNHWQKEVGTKFLSYAGFWIRQSMVRYLEKNSNLSRKMYGKVGKYLRTLSQFESECNRKPTSEELCDLMEIDEKELESIEKAAVEAEIASLDSPASEDSESSIGDLMPSGEDLESSVIDQVEQEQLSKVLWDMVDSLPGEVPEVLRERFQEQKTRKQIGMEKGMNEKQIAWLELKGIRRLKKLDRKIQLLPYVDDYIQARVFHGYGITSFNRTWTSSTERIAIDLIER